MTKIGTVIEDKYEILKEIGRGGMSIVYLAMDKHLNKQWAVKEIRKKGNGKNDEIVVNSLLAEANLMKRLDHPALPRIVDIIDNGITIYVVMDYIEGESLDVILNEFGAQPESQVIEWAKQLCDALSYLHSQKPPIIYRDMKPANIMLKPEGNIKIIDFGIAREYKEQNLSDTTVLGTKGYAPPEQYSGQTDPRSDIFALGMTMHHLLTGVDPRNGEAYAPVREWNPELTEGIESIIDKCTEPAAENRYQNCGELLFDLQDPAKVTKGWKKRLKKRLAAFVISSGLCMLSVIVGFVCKATSSHINNRDYDFKLSSSDPANYYDAIEIYPGRVDAYNKLIGYYKTHDTKNEDFESVGNRMESNSESLDINNSEVAQLYYDAGKLYFSEYDGTFKSRAVSSKSFFQVAVGSEADFSKKNIAKCYYSICNFMTNQSKTSEHTLKEYQKIIEEIEAAIKIVESADDNEANYDRISLYYITMLFLNDQAEYMAGVGFDEKTVESMLSKLYMKSAAITSTLSYVDDLKTEISNNYDAFITNIQMKYKEVEKRHNESSIVDGGN